ncbi:hypothetical protein KIN20_036990 [Parelaphostrongylus tenuis]|uniref:Uncharacterized protein n=1 Tax=Parelaphostrongylus tenuis TaxID=148309 RepID=A0AAD5RDB2_PARTN|nr:hypothetical protein KIN20_036990 [Parelaphostrongylus tenuis]
MFEKTHDRQLLAVTSIIAMLEKRVDPPTNVVNFRKKKNQERSLSNLDNADSELYVANHFVKHLHFVDIKSFTRNSNHTRDSINHTISPSICIPT